METVLINPQTESKCTNCNKCKSENRYNPYPQVHTFFVCTKTKKDIRLTDSCEQFKCKYL